MNPASWFRDKIRSEYLIVDRNSWHYRLVNYVYGAGFFYKDAWKLETYKEVMRIIEQTKDIQYREFVQKELERGAYKPELPRNITLCTYFWATVGAMIFGSWVVWIHKNLTRRRGSHLNYKPTSIWRRFSIALGVWLFVGAYSLIRGDIFYGIENLAIFGALAIMIWQKKYFISGFSKIADWTSRKHVELPQIKIKKPGIGILGLFIAMLKAEKDKNCPRIDFVDRYEYKAPDKDIEP